MNFQESLLELMQSLPVSVILSIQLLAAVYLFLLVTFTSPTLAFTLGVLLVAASVRIIVFLLD